MILQVWRMGMFITQLPIKCDSGDIWEMFHEAFMGMYVNIINNYLENPKIRELNFMTLKIENG